MSASFISKTVHVCNCGPGCKCGYSTAIASSCGCGVPTVERVVLAEDIDHFYVSQTGEKGKAYTTLGTEPFTSPDGNPLQRFPKAKYLTSRDELKDRAQKGIGNLSDKLSPNYLAKDIEGADPSADHHHPENISIRRATHRGKEIVITTTYEITIDGKPFANHVMVDDRGRVHCHGLPNYAYASMLDLITRIVDAEVTEAELEATIETTTEHPPNAPHNNTHHNNQSDVITAQGGHH